MNPDEALLLACISLGSFFIPLLCKRLLIPSAVGEILFGLTIGIFIPNIPDDIPTIKFLSELGFIILMYLAGMEIDFQVMKKIPRRTIWLYLVFFLCLILCAFAIAILLQQHTIYALIYLTCAVGLLFPVLKDAEILDRPFGQSLLILAGIGEIVSILAITTFILYLKFGLSLQTLWHLLEIIVFLMISYFFFKCFQLYMWWHPLQIELFLKTGDAAETGIRANFVNMFLFVSLAAAFDIELIIGAFLGGMLFAMIFKQREDIKEKMSAFGYGFLIPLFFIEVGLRFDMKDFADWHILYLALQMAIIILAVRVVCSTVLTVTDFSPRQLLVIPFGLSFPLTLLVAVATIGLQLKVITTKEGATILVTVLITALVYPWIFKLLLKIHPDE